MPVRLAPYDRKAAVLYAHRWAYGRNPQYYDFEDLGGDCTNFASQCLYAGTGVMNFTPTFGWYYNSLSSRAPAWSGVPYFYNFLTQREGGPGPVGDSCSLRQLRPGDFVQLCLAGEVYSHNPVVVAVSDPPDPAGILVAAHSQDTDYRPLNTYPAKKVRFIHILGVRMP